MMTFKTTMGALSVVIMFAAYAIYIWQTTRGKGVKPHPFSWFLWGILTGVVYLVQVLEGEGPGSWVAGFTSLICFLIGAVSFFKYQWRFSLFDWLSVTFGLFVFGIYLISKNPTLSAILATASDVIGYGPTFKKGWAAPNEDSVSSFALNSAKYIPSVLALNSYSVATCVYPIALVIMNGAVAAMLLLRRHQAEQLSQNN
jgi:hypothetical protein